MPLGLSTGLSLLMGSRVGGDTFSITEAAALPSITAAAVSSWRDQNLRDIFTSQTAIFYTDTTIVGSVTQSGGLVTDFTDTTLSLSFTAAGAARPAYNASNSEFNGKPTLAGDAANTIMAAAINLPPPGSTPTWILCVMRQTASTSTRPLWGTASNTLACNQGTSPGLLIRNTTAGPANNDAPVGGTGNVRALNCLYNNGTTDYLRMGSGTKATGTNVGNTDPGASFSLFSRTGTTLGAAIELALFGIWPGEPTAGELTAILAYCNSKFGSPT